MPECFYTENFKRMLKEMEEYLKKWKKIAQIHGSENLTLLKE